MTETKYQSKYRVKFFIPNFIKYFKLKEKMPNHINNSLIVVRVSTM